jgi:hypothetical protein
MPPKKMILNISYFELVPRNCSWAADREQIEHKLSPAFIINSPYHDGLCIYVWLLCDPAHLNLICIHKIRHGGFSQRGIFRGESSEGNLRGEAFSWKKIFAEGNFQRGIFGGECSLAGKFLDSFHEALESLVIVRYFFALNTSHSCARTTSNKQLNPQSCASMQQRKE